MRWYGDEPFSCDAGDRWTDDEGVERVSSGDGRWVTITRPPSDEKLELLEIDRVLRAEGVGAGALPGLTRTGRIRRLGAKRRKAEKRIVNYEVMEGQMTVDDCIAEVERNIAARPPWDGHA